VKVRDKYVYDTLHEFVEQEHHLCAGAAKTTSY
jgi:hypothetical protein